MTAPQTASSLVGGARDQRLREAIERARRSPFYAQHLAGKQATGRGDLHQLPLTFKHHLNEAGPFGMLAVPPAKAWHYHESSGTTGQPTSTWCGVEELHAMAEMLLRMVPELSQSPIFLNRFPLFAPISFTFEEALRRSGGCHVAAGTMTWDTPFARAVDFISRLGVTALGALPLELMFLREVALEQGRDLERDFRSVRLILCGGAVLPPALRRIIERDWNARVVELYGSNETMGLGLGCVHGRLHLCANMVEPEVLDPDTHEPVADGEPGILTVTSLIHHVMPLVRYFTGDILRIDRQPCACGEEGPTAQVLGRLDEIVDFEGVRLTTHDVLDAAYDFADRERTQVFFILVRRAGLHLQVEVADPERARDGQLEQQLRQRLRVPVSVEYLPRNELLDRGSLLRTPRIGKPSLISDWRGEGRKPIAILEALLEFPRLDMRTLMGLGGRMLRNRRRKRRLMRSDRPA